MNDARRSNSNSRIFSDPIIRFYLFIFIIVFIFFLLPYPLFKNPFLCFLAVFYFQFFFFNNALSMGVADSLQVTTAILVLCAT